MKKAFCPPEVEENPILQVLKYHVFPRLDTVTLKRPEKFGGDMEFTSYEECEKLYGEGKIHPADLKAACTEGIVEVLAPARDYLGL